MAAMASSPTTPRESAPLKALDNLPSGVLEAVDARVAALLDVQANSRAAAVLDATKVLAALQSACDEQAARLEWFVATGRRVTKLLVSLGAEVQDDAPEPPLPSLGEALAAAAGKGGAPAGGAPGAPGGLPPELASILASVGLKL